MPSSDFVSSDNSLLQQISVEHFIVICKSFSFTEMFSHVHKTTGRLVRFIQNKNRSVLFCLLLQYLILGVNVIVKTHSKMSDTSEAYNTAKV